MSSNSQTNILLIPSLVLLIIVSVQIKAFFSTITNKLPKHSTAETGPVQVFEGKIMLLNSIEPSVETRSKHEMSVNFEPLNPENIDKDKTSEKVENDVNADYEPKTVNNQDRYKSCFGLLHEGGWREMVQTLV